MQIFGFTEMTQLLLNIHLMLFNNLKAKWNFGNWPSSPNHSNHIYQLVLFHATKHLLAGFAEQQLEFKYRFCSFLFNQTSQIRTTSDGTQFTQMYYIVNECS